VKLFHPSDLKVFAPGAGLALATGLFLGGLMQPHLDEGDQRPAGPQMLADWAGERSSGPFDPGTTFAAYHGNPPDYVMGTDWKRAMAWPDERAATPAPREVVETEAAATDPTPVLSHAIYDEPPPPHHDDPSQGYPSLGGRTPTAASATDAGVEDDTLPTAER